VSGTKKNRCEGEEDRPVKRTKSMVLDQAANERKVSSDSEIKASNDSDTEEIPATDPDCTVDAVPTSNATELRLKTGMTIDMIRIGDKYDLLDSTSRWCEGEVCYTSFYL